MVVSINNTDATKDEIYTYQIKKKKLTVCHFDRMWSIQKKGQQQLDLEGL